MLHVGNGNYVAKGDGFTDLYEQIKCAGMGHKSLGMGI
jgi:hypothetical protein